MSKLIYLSLIFFLTSCSSDSGESKKPDVFQEEASLEILAERADVIWGFDFLPDDKFIFTQRADGIFILDLKTLQVSTVTGVPTPQAFGEGGLLDLKVHPNFAANKYVYYCYTQQSFLGRALAVDRGVLQGEALTDIETIFRSIVLTAQAFISDAG